MSVGRVHAAIEEMEAWLDDPSWDPNPEALARWRAEFQEALVHAEQAPGWPALRNRAHAAGQRLEARAAAVAQAQDQLRTELEAQERGGRALRGYGASAR